MTRDEFLKTKMRVDRQRHNGRFTAHDQERAERIADHKRQLEEQIAADDRPISERVPEFVMDYDDSGNYIGLKPARPQTPGPDQPDSTGRSER